MVSAFVGHVLVPAVFAAEVMAAANRVTLSASLQQDLEFLGVGVPDSWDDMTIQRQTNWWMATYMVNLGRATESEWSEMSGQARAALFESHMSEVIEVGARGYKCEGKAAWFCRNESWLIPALAASTGAVDVNQVVREGAIAGVTSVGTAGAFAGVSAIRVRVKDVRAARQAIINAPEPSSTALVPYNADAATGQLARNGDATASELIEFGTSQGWTQSQTLKGPIKFTDEFGVI